MKPHPLEQALNQLDISLDNMLEELAAYPEEVLYRKPEENAWSVVEVMQHVRMSERHSVAYVRHKVQSGSPVAASGWRQRLRLLSLQIFLRSPFKFKAPKVVNEDSFPEERFDKLVQGWKSERAALRELLTTLDEAWLHKELFRHPLAGRMSLNHMLTFFHEHFDRHREQIRRTAGAVK
jgi:uncharacterized damage-inducible protein DinB